MADRLTTITRKITREARERRRFGSTNAELLASFEQMNRERTGDLLATLITNALTAPRTGGGVE